MRIIDSIIEFIEVKAIIVVTPEALNAILLFDTGDNWFVEINTDRVFLPFYCPTIPGMPAA